MCVGAKRKKFYPDFWFESIHTIPSDFFYNHDIKYVLLDIDNTLVSYTRSTADEGARRFLNLLTENGIKYAFVSNNHRERVEEFAREFGAVYINDAAKPLRIGIRKAMRRLSSDAAHTAIIGDQVFTDVWAGKRSGIMTVMVEPIEAKETPFFGIKRKLEKIVLKGYVKS